MKKIVFAAILVFIIGIIGTVSFGGSIFSFGPMVDIDEQKSFKANEIKNIEIQSDIGDIKFMESENDQIDVRIHGEVSKQQKDRYKFEIKQNGDTLYVTSETKGKTFFSIPINIGNNGKRVIEVKLPKGVLESVDIETDIGDIDIELLEVEELMISSDVGDVKIDQFMGDKASLETNVGDIKIKNAIGEIDVESNTGDINVSIDTIQEDVTIATNVGEVTVKINGEHESVALDLDTDVGDIDIDGTFMMGHNSNGPTVEVRTNVGDINIEG